MKWYKFARQFSSLPQLTTSSSHSLEGTRTVVMKLHTRTMEVLSVIPFRQKNTLHVVALLKSIYIQIADLLRSFRTIIWNHVKWEQSEALQNTTLSEWTIVNEDVWSSKRLTKIYPVECEVSKEFCRLYSMSIRSIRRGKNITSVRWWKCGVGRKRRQHENMKLWLRVDRR